MTGHDPAAWAGFAGLVLALLVLDLGVLNRKSHVLTVGEAALWSAGLVATALLFGGFLFLRAGTRVLRRLPGRALAQRRQPVRLPADLPVLRGARGAPAPGAQVGDLRGD